MEPFGYAEQDFIPRIEESHTLAARIPVHIQQAQDRPFDDHLALSLDPQAMVPQPRNIVHVNFFFVQDCGKRHAQ